MSWFSKSKTDDDTTDLFDKKVKKIKLNGTDGTEVDDSDYLYDQFPKDFKEVKEELKKLRESLDRFMADTISTYKQEINRYKNREEVLQNKLFALMEKLIERPPPASSRLDNYLAKKEAGGGFAAVDAKAKK